MNATCGFLRDPVICLPHCAACDSGKTYDNTQLSLAGPMRMRLSGGRHTCTLCHRLQRSPQTHAENTMAMQHLHQQPIPLERTPRRSSAHAPPRPTYAHTPCSPKVKLMMLSLCVSPSWTGNCHFGVFFHHVVDRENVTLMTHSPTLVLCLGHEKGLSTLDL